MSNVLAHPDGPGVMPAEGPGTDEHTALWMRWHAMREPATRQQLIGTYLSFARMLAAKTYATRTHDDVPFADYYQLASLGLLEAIDRYDPQRGVRFRSYASKRIVGAILNGLENQTEKTSQISEQRRLRRERIASIKDTARRRGCDALKESEGDGESAGDTGMACRPEALFLYLAEVSMGVALGILLEDTAMIDHDAFGSAGHAAGPEVNYFRNDAIRRLQADVQHAIAQLVPVQQSVVRMHYLQSMAFTDIANHLALSRGRISQLHRQALENLQALVRPPPDFDMAA
jgi:RNA polymerase sigma factor FliA